MRNIQLKGNNYKLKTQLTKPFTFIFLHAKQHIWLGNSSMGTVTISPLQP